MRAQARAATAAIAVGFLLLHLPFLPASLEDLDSINFALGLHRYDVAHHQPHPPGYPVFIALGRAARGVTASDAHALSAIGIAAGTLGVVALFAFFGELERLALARTRRSAPETDAGEGERSDLHAGSDSPSAHDPRAGRYLRAGPEGWIPWAAALVAATSPLYWFTAARPLSDLAGLAAAIGVQAWILAAATPLSFAGAAFAAGVAAGIRSQVVWLTVPLLILIAFRRAPEATGAPRSVWFRVVVSSWSWLWPFIVGCLVWAVPMVTIAGGPAAYWRALFSQGAEDLSGIQMLWTRPTPRELVAAFYYAFVAPWALWSIAVVVIVFAIVGAVLAFRFWRGALLALVVAYGPYFIFDLLFQETFTTRYALPLVVPVAYLAVRGAAAFGWRPGIVVALAISMFDAHIGGTSLAAYAREKAPAFRMLDDMSGARPPAAPVLAMDRREQLDLRRPMVWLGGRMPPTERRLPSPPQHEWLELVKYWNGGGRNPVWFVADPLRTDIDLVQHDDPVAYRWPVPYPVLLGGVRPNEMDWYRIVRPFWYVGEGWALTPEAAGVAEAAAIGLMHGPIHGWTDAAAVAGGAIVVGGRNFEPAIQTRLTIAVDGWFRKTLTVGPGAYLDLERLPALERHAAVEPAPITVTSDPPARVAVEQFDIAPPGRVVFGFGAGWNEQEYNPVTGRRWRWLSERGELRALASGKPVRLHVEGESPRVYFSKPSRLTVRVGSTVAFDDTLSSDFAIDVTVPASLAGSGETTITLETDQVYVPAERSSRTRDRRHLGLRIYKCELRDARVRP